jgi:hypothetical protein
VAAGGAAGGIDGSSVGGGAGVVTVRVVNLTLASGPTAGPSLDIYDDMYDGSLQPSVSGTPSRGHRLSAAGRSQVGSPTHRPTETGERSPERSGGSPAATAARVGPTLWSTT